MSNQELPGPVDPAEASEAAAQTPLQGDDQAAAAPLEQRVEERVPVESEHAPIEVGLERSVRIGRIIIVCTVLGAVIGAVASLFFPVLEDADYELGQVVGQMLVVGGAIGLVFGALFALLLGILVRRQKGAAIAVQTDVR